MAYYCVSAAVLICLFAQSLTHAFAWDEGFHVLVAQLIAHGQRPYIDFCFSQTPLNAYWNAAWMAVFGETWRSAHAAASFCSAIAIWLAGGVIRTRFPVFAWRLPGAVAATLFAGLNILVFQFGGISQAYGMGMMALMASYRFALLSPENGSPRYSALSGLFCGIAAGSTLLTIPAGPVMLVWIVMHNRLGNRWIKVPAFLIGGLAAFIPVFWLLMQGARQVIFGIFDYNFSYRQVGWPGATEHNIGVYLSLIGSGPALILILLAIGGLLFVRFRAAWDSARKSEFYLCAWLILALTAFISTARPTFERYYIFTVPFLAVLGAAGLYWLSGALYKAGHPWPAVAVLGILLSCGIAKSSFDNWDALNWPDLEKVAAQVSKVARPGERLFADEAIYFLTRLQPPHGMEMRDSHKFDLPPDRLALFHLIPETELDRQVEAGAFDILETCSDKDEIEEHGYSVPYASSEDIAGCYIYWNRK